MNAVLYDVALTAYIVATGACLAYLVNRTRLGRSMRAVALDREAARGEAKPFRVEGPDHGEG